MLHCLILSNSQATTIACHTHTIFFCIAFNQRVGTTIQLAVKRGHLFDETVTKYAENVSCKYATAKLITSIRNKMNERKKTISFSPVAQATLLIANISGFAIGSTFFPSTYANNRLLFPAHLWFICIIFGRKFRISAQLLS